MIKTKRSASSASTFSYSMVKLRESDVIDAFPEIILKRAKSNGSHFENKSIMIKGVTLTPSTDIKLFSPSYSQGASDMSNSKKQTKTIVVLSPSEDGYIVAECPSMPGCVSQGQTREEAIENIKEAIELSREVWQDLNLKEFEVVELEV